MDLSSFCYLYLKNNLCLIKTLEACENGMVLDETSILCKLHSFSNSFQDGFALYPSLLPHF